MSMADPDIEEDPAAVEEGETLTREDLVRRLEHLAVRYDSEAAHVHADDLLLTYIDDEEVAKAFRGVPKEYA